MASVLNGVETLEKISIARVKRTNVLQTTDRRTNDDIREFTFAKNDSNILSMPPLV